MLRTVKALLHPRPLLLAVALAALAGLASVDAVVRAGDDDGPERTQVKIYTPWLPNGMLNPAVTVRMTTPNFEGNPNLPSPCQSGSISTQRPDAWRCVTADPCFSPTPYSATQVACSNSPWSNEVVLLQLSRPLPGPQECSMMPRDCPPDDVNLNSPPWALELANGAQCTKFTGTISSLGGLGLVYGCNDGGSVGIANEMMPFDTSDPLWHAFYLPMGGTAFEQVAITVAWY
jgi:hypothetical protein